MKRIGVVILTVCIAAMTMTTAFAETLTEEVWLDASGDTDVNGTLTATVETNANTTDGLITVSYDADKLSITEDDVEKSDGIVMWAVNVVTPGTLKISFIAEEPTESGTLFSLNFTAKASVSEDELAELLDMSGEYVNTTGGEAAFVKKQQEADPTPSLTPEPSATVTPSPEPTSAATPTPAPTEKPDDGKNPTTGDTFRWGIILTVAVCGAAVAGATYYQKKVKR